MSAESNQQAYRRLVAEGFGKGNMAVVDEVVSADLVEHEQLPPGFPSGAAGLKAFITMIREAFSEIEMSIEDITADDDKVWARLKAHVNNTGPFMGMPPTGKRATFEIIDICRYADGKLVEHWGVTDNLGMMQQLGVIPAPGQPTGAPR